MFWRAVPLTRSKMLISYSSLCCLLLCSFWLLFLPWLLCCHGREWVKTVPGWHRRQLQDHFPYATFLVFNFREGDQRSQISDVLSQHDMTVMDYPSHYQNCPLLPLEMIHHFLKSSESWLSLEGQQNVLLMHCEKGGWPVLAFMLSGLLLYRKQYQEEQKTLEMYRNRLPRIFFINCLLYIPSLLNSDIFTTFLEEI